jgi:hypothetical protein
MGSLMKQLVAVSFSFVSPKLLVIVRYTRREFSPEPTNNSTLKTVENPPVLRRQMFNEKHINLGLTLTKFTPYFQSAVRGMGIWSITRKKNLSELAEHLRCMHFTKKYLKRCHNSDFAKISSSQKVCTLK